MASGRQDALLWLGLGIFGFCATRIVHVQLLAIRKASQITKEEKPPELISQHTENAVKLDTLRQLADGANQDIRTAAVKIIIERATQAPTYELLLQDIAGKDPSRRDKALTSLKFLEKTSVNASLGTQATYTALITCLTAFLSSPLAHPLSSTLDTNLPSRPQPEKDALYILRKCMRWDLSAALRAGLITRWLAKYPFGGPSASENEKREIVKRIKSNQTDDMDMCEILHMVDYDPEGRKQLRKCGLVGSAMWEDRDDEDIHMLGGDDTAGLSSIAGRRIREESLEEQALRRRRREAVVISDGGRPLGQRDIFERADTGGTDPLPDAVEPEAEFREHGEDDDMAPDDERQTERFHQETERLRRIRRETERLRRETGGIRREERGWRRWLWYD